MIRCRELVSTVAGVQCIREIDLDEEEASAPHRRHHSHLREPLLAPVRTLVLGREAKSRTTRVDQRDTLKAVNSTSLPKPRPTSPRQVLCMTLPNACDVLIVGAGAAGLFASIHAGRAAAASAPSLTLIAVDTARKLGAKILVAGGGRCNVTHHAVDERDYAGSTPAAIRKVLRRYRVEDVVAFFAAAGVDLKREDTGKLFPVSDSARSVLAALLEETAVAGVHVVHPARVQAVRPLGEPAAATGFAVETEAGSITARRVILSTGGRSLPKSGSDGSGFALAASLGHQLTAPILPSLVPLVLADAHFIRGLSGLTLPTRLTLTSATGKRLCSTEGSTLCTHQGLSGPAVLDISRHYLMAQHADRDVQLKIDWLPQFPVEELERHFREARGRGAVAVLRQHLPDRLARLLCEQAGCPTSGDIPKEARRRLLTAVSAMTLPVVGDRGFAVAEATAGGVPLKEVRLESMESRLCPGLYFAGEVLDVDGRIGGFNFQWAWASGFVAGTSAVAACVAEASSRAEPRPQ